jgi:hypothetical protein
VRWVGRTSRERYIRVLDSGTTFRVNRTVAAVMDACSGGTPGDALRYLQARHREIPLERLERDTFRAVRWLTLHRVLEPQG